MNNKFKKLIENFGLAREVYLTVFNRSIKVLFIDKNKVPHILDTCEGVFMHKGLDMMIVIDNNVDHIADRYNLIIHESYHATQHILNGIGLVLSSDSEEAYAYTQGHISSSIISMILEEDYAPTQEDYDTTVAANEWVQEFSKQIEHL